MQSGEGTEGKILENALRLFVRKGYHGTSINDIMVAVGMTKGAFYSHFESKGALFLRLVQEFKARFFDPMVAEMADFKGNALEKLGRILAFITRFGRENTDLCVFLTFLTPELNTDMDFESELRRIFVDYQQFISRVIRQGVEEGSLKKEIRPDLTALIFMALNDGVVNHLWRLNKNQLEDSDLYFQTFSDIFLTGIRASVD